MKPRLFVSISTLLTSIVFSVNCLAQETSLVKVPGVVLATNKTTVSSGNAAVSSNVVKIFDRNFKNARNLIWENAGENLFVSFMVNDQPNTALFKKNGYLINHIAHGYERHLPADIRKIIKTHPDYFDYTITNVTNIKQDKRDVWAAYLQQNNNIILVRAENGVLEEVERFSKK